MKQFLVLSKFKNARGFCKTAETSVHRNFVESVTIDSAKTDFELNSPSYRVIAIVDPITGLVPIKKIKRAVTVYPVNY